MRQRLIHLTLWRLGFRIAGVFALVGSLGLLHSCRSSGPERGLVATRAMAVSARAEASNVGAAVMKAGGNAVDAAVAVKFALAVTYPVAGNLGGGGFMIYRRPDGVALALDFRETAPTAAHRDMYLDSSGAVIDGLSTIGRLSAGVPGTVAGMAEAHRRFGSLPWAELVQPALELARDGFALTDRQANYFNSYAGLFDSINPDSRYLRKEGDWKAGDTLVQRDLAWTLEHIRDYGTVGFYEGPVADLLVSEVARGGGVITNQDLLAYRPRWRGPVVTRYFVDTISYVLLSMSPPSSGGVALAQLLEMVEPFPLDAWGVNRSRSVHLMVEAERRVYADRARHLGDPDFWNVPIAQLTDSAYLAGRMADFNTRQATDSRTVEAGRFHVDESPQTTHFSIVDPQGGAVSLTTTINSAFGSKVFVRGAGFLLNNEMDDFSVKAGVPNQFGLLGDSANAIEPGKRMLSSMTPTIVERNGALFMVLGTPGGSTIITSVFQNILNVTEHGMGMQESVSRPRFHHQWRPDSIRVEPGALDDSTRARLEALGHSIYENGNIGRVDAILVLPDGRLEAGADPRGDDAAAGVN